jgi:hypothetical protein
VYLAEIVADVEIKTTEVSTVNDALLAPAGMNTLEGTLAAPLLLERVISAPPAGAGALRVTVPRDACPPPTTLVGFSVSELSVGAGGGTGLTDSDSVFVTPPRVAVMVTEIDALTTLVPTANVALVVPAAIVTLAGVRATVVLLLESAICAPPVGAGPLNVTVPVDEFPPTTLVGFTASEFSATAGGAADCTVSEEDLLTPA